VIDPRGTRARLLVAAALVLLAASGHAADVKKPTAPPTAEGRTHVVATGDTLFGIAARYGVTVRALVAANRLASERVTLRVGQRLSIPAATAAKTPSTPGAGSKPSVSARPSQALASTPASSRGARAESPGREGRACCAPPRCCGPRNLMLFVPDFVELSPLFSWPVEGPITSTFGRRRTGWHRGIDIKADRGAAVFAAAAGVVLTSDREPRYGRVVKIEHDGGFLTVYAHNEENLVEPGMRVAAGDPVATIGRTGRATAHHLHFEIRRDGSVYNPLYLLPLPPRVGQVEESEETEEEHD
jgi:murein DD-endopeptidase MepM/ murein hydrolase activator NlpD